MCDGVRLTYEGNFEGRSNSITTLLDLPQAPTPKAFRVD